MEKNNGNYIELNAFLRVNNIAVTGGKAKLIIREGKVKVNNEIETRNKKKLYAGDIIEFESQKFIIEEQFLR